MTTPSLACRPHVSQKNFPWLRLAILVLFVFVYPLRHLTYSPNGIMAYADGPSILPRTLNLIPELLAVGIVLASFNRIRFSHWEAPWPLLMWILLFTLPVSAFNSKDPIIVLIAGLRVYGRWVFPFLIGVFLATEKDIQWIISLVLITGLVQTPLALLQSHLARGSIWGGDAVTGLMGGAGSGYLAMFQMACAAFVFARYMAGHMRLIPSLLLIVSLLLPVPFSEARVSFFLWPLASLGVVFLGGGPVRKRVLLLMIVILLLALGGTLYADTNRWALRHMGITSFWQLYQPALWKLYFGRDLPSGAANRWSIVVLAHQEISRSTGTLLFGLGPGAASRALFSGSGFLLALYNGYLIQPSLVMTVLSELGYAGLASWSLFLVSVYRSVIRLQRTRVRFDDSASIAPASGFKAIVLMLAICAFYNLSFLNPALMFIFMIISGYMVQHSPRSHETVSRGETCPVEPLET